MSVNVWKHSIGIAILASEWHSEVSIYVPFEFYRGISLDLRAKCGVAMIYARSKHLHTSEWSWGDRHDWLIRSTFPSILDNLGRPDFGLSNVEPVSSNLPTHFWMSGMRPFNIAEISWHYNSSTHNARSAPEKCSITPKLLRMFCVHAVK